MKRLTIVALLLVTGFAHASDTELTPKDAALLAELTQTLERKTSEVDRQSDGAATILETSVASERAEYAGD